MENPKTTSQDDTVEGSEIQQKLPAAASGATTEVASLKTGETTDEVSLKNSSSVDSVPKDSTGEENFVCQEDLLLYEDEALEAELSEAAAEEADSEKNKTSIEQANVKEVKPDIGSKEITANNVEITGYVLC